MRVSTVEVICRCGQKLFRYHKQGTGRLIKCFIERIVIDNVKLKPKLPIGTDVFCPECKNRVGTIQMIHTARPAYAARATFPKTHHRALLSFLF